MWVMIAGPYTAGAKTPEDRARNLAAMNSAASQVFDRGHTPIIDAAGPSSFDRIMMPVSLALAQRCDAVLRIGGPSHGADQEADSFRARNLPVFTSIDDLPPATMRHRPVLAAAEREFRRYKDMAEKAASQLTWDQLRVSLDPETNSIAVVMKHIAGNLRSRWTDVLTTDGEKPWRDRDTEFVDDFPDRAALDLWWTTGWNAALAQLSDLTDADLTRVVPIRNEPHTLALALSRSLAHTSYHVGQITQLARALASKAGAPWTTLTVPRGKSREHNRSMGYEPGAGGPR